MDMQTIIAVLETERDRLDSAIEALNAQQRSANGKRKAMRFLTAAQRKRISDGMKKRWAERKKAVSTS